MIDRLDLQNILEEILGSENVYFQSPPNTGMKYPCIIYSFNRYNIAKADNKPYIINGNWTLTHCFKSLNNDTIKNKMIFIDGCTFDRRIVKDGIYNDYYTIIK